MFRGVIGFIVIVFSVLTVNQKADAFILINEILADPPAGIAGDANGDGVSSSSADEFIELFNNSSNAVDLSGWSISDAARERHMFSSGLFLSPNQLLVIFGGGSPQLPGGYWQLASTGTLSLNNTADTITLFDANHSIIDQVVYGSEAGHDQSITRFPEGNQGPFVEHLSLPNSGGLRYSPGYFVDRPETQAAVPEISTLYALGLGVPWMLRRRKMMGARQMFFR